MEAKDVMIDLETLGNGKNACVVQIGACYFNRETGEIGDKFKVNVDAESAMRSGADMDASTVYWWLSQSPEAIASIIAQPRVSIEQAFTDLNVFLSGARAIWSHATFDFVTITETYKRLNIKPLFGFRAARDIRTLVDLAKITVDGRVRIGTHHDGLADAIHQVGYCVEALNKIKRRQE